MTAALPRVRRILLVFVDGLGMGSDDPGRNPIYSGASPHLADLLRNESAPIDAGLGVAGLPQSATGQTALLTGVNAAQLVGRHVEGFPGRELRAVIEEHNVYGRLRAAGRRGTFANAYFVDDVAEASAARIKSVTTVAALAGVGAVRTKVELAANAAVYQDLTRESLRQRGYTGPLVRPAQSAQHLLAIAAEHDLTLFEYFQTDRAGHRSDIAAAKHVLALLDEFLGALIAGREQDLLIVLTSDHGNIEDPSTRSHTPHPVPLAAVGPGAAALRQAVHSLTDVTPALLALLGVDA